LNVGLARFVIRAVTQHLHNHIGGAKYFCAVGCDSRAFGNVLCVRISGTGTGTGLDDHLHSCFCQVGNDCRDQGDASFPRINFSGHAYNHEQTSCGGHFVCEVDMV
jgi:hypothetical protein